MTTRFRRPMLVLGTTILVMQAVFMPVGMVYAQTENEVIEESSIYSQYSAEYDTKINKLSGNQEYDFDVVDMELNNFEEDNFIREQDFYNVVPNVTTSELFVQLDSQGLPLTNRHLIPDNLIFANGWVSGVSRVLVNGTVIPDQSTRFLRNRDIITFENIGKGPCGGPLIAKMEFNPTGTGNSAVSINYEGVLDFGYSTTGMWPFKMSFYDSNGIEINTPIWTSYNLAATSFPLGNLTFQRESITLLSSENSALRGTVNDSSIVINIGQTAIFNLVTTGQVSGSFNLLRGPLSLFRQQGITLDSDYGDLSIEGVKTEKDMKSRYKISQRIPGFINKDLNISLSSPSILTKEQLSVLSITDDNGNNFEGRVEVSKSEDQVIFSISQSNLEYLKSNYLYIDVEIPINMEQNFGDYLEEDYLVIDSSITNDRSSIEAQAYSYNWVRPWGKAVEQLVGVGSSTVELNPTEFVEHLENKLEGDEPFVVGFSEERTFDHLEETTVDVLIESAISGIQNTVEVPVTVVENKGNVFVYHEDKEGNTLLEQEELIGTIGEPYDTKAKEIPNYQLVSEPENAKGVFLEEDIEVTYVYEIAPVNPVDPLDPEIEVNPENKPEIPEDQGLLSIDFISSFDFGSQVISAHDQTYYAQPQHLLNEDGTVNESEERPNYVQISDRRSENERNGWQLAVTQKEQFKTESNQELSGARLNLSNQQLVTTQGGDSPSLQVINPLVLIPGNKRTLIRAEGTEGTGTWIYRFGDSDTAGQSVALDIPKGANPNAANYSTTLTWELSAVPSN